MKRLRLSSHGAPSVLAVLLVLAIIRIRYKLSFAIKRKDRADWRSRYELVDSIQCPESRRA
ncbi:MAG: hypothetical protein V3T99_03870, partial [Nitrososphaerales archaeon]